MTSSQQIVALWFAGSIALAVVENLAFALWLRRMGAPFELAWSGVPGHLDRAYAAWCERVGRSPRRRLLLRRLVLVNLVAAVLAAIPLLGRGR